MVRSGLIAPDAPGNATGGPPSAGCALAMQAWMRCAGPDVRFSDLVAALACDEVDDWELMIARIDAIRAVVAEARREQ